MLTFFSSGYSSFFILNSPIILRPTLSMSLEKVMVSGRIPMLKELKSKVYEENQKDLKLFNYRKNKLRKI